MADGFIRWYRESAATSVLAEQTRLFAEYGIHLAHPVTGATTAVDVEGEDVPIGQEELALLLGRRIAPVTMNWWLSADTNVLDSFAYEPLGCEVQTLWLDGLTVDEAHRVESAVIAATTRLAAPTRAVIVDRRGVTDPDDWDSPLLYDGDEVPRFPDAVVAPGPVADRLAARTPGLVRAPAGAHRHQCLINK
ncbi:hypothetical protein [Streptomyces venezuelae]|uniref:hypothetical protein n=1 Tax=Streptomyces venezuelae TaxID=54571 RepID=UPI00278C04DF|nr:hypothetical protein [Streptomyces venezuelae]